VNKNEYPRLAEKDNNPINQKTYQYFFINCIYPELTGLIKPLARFFQL